MEKNSISLTKWAMTYGLYLGVFHVIYLLVLYFRNHLFDNSFAGYILIVFVIGIIWIGLTGYRDKVNNGFLSYGQGVGLGVLISLFGGIFAAATMYILMTFDKSLSDQLLVVTQENLMKSGLPDELIESVSEMYEIAVKPGLVAFSEFFGKIFSGTLISLIVAAIAMKKPTSSFYDAVKNVE